MEDDDIKNWGYYDQPMRSNLGLQLMPSLTAERDTKNLISHGTFLPRNCGIPEPSIPMEYLRDAWFQQKEKIMQGFPFSHPNYAGITDARPLQMHPMPDLSRDERSLQIEDPRAEKDETLKKKPQRKPSKISKPRNPRKVQAPKDESVGIGSAPRGRARRKNTELVINGIDWDMSQIATPVCTCTGAPQACYRWGAGGWQSACCTNNLSTYPLPMSSKRRGARIAGRKMSQGAFKKVLEKLAGEGYAFSDPIDLRSYWAKHGTNKFVTIR